MTHHENEGIIDKVKNALGMGSDDHDGDDHHQHDSETPIDLGSTDVTTDVENRPAGPDYGAGERTSTAPLPHGDTASHDSNVITDDGHSEGAETVR